MCNGNGVIHTLVLRKCCSYSCTYGCTLLHSEEVTDLGTASHTVRVLHCASKACTRRIVPLIPTNGEYGIRLLLIGKGKESRAQLAFAQLAFWCSDFYALVHGVIELHLSHAHVQLFIRAQCVCVCVWLWTSDRVALARLRCSLVGVPDLKH